MQTRALAPRQVPTLDRQTLSRRPVTPARPESLDSFVSSGGASPALKRAAVGAGIGAYGFVAASSVLPTLAAALSGPWGPVGAHLALAGVGAAIGWAASGKEASAGRKVLGAVVGAAAAGAATVSGGAPVLSRLALGAVGGGLYGLTRQD